MKKKLAFLLTALLLSDGICRLTELCPQNEVIGIAMEQMKGCAVVKAAETSEDKKTIEEMESNSADGSEKDIAAEDTIKEDIPTEDTMKEDSEESKELTDNKETEVLEQEKKESTKTEDRESPEAAEDEEETLLNEETNNIENEKEEEAQEDTDVYNVSFPTDSRAYLDPDNLSGRGQIFSEDFKIENYGNTDVAIKIKNIEVYYRSTEEVYELSETEVTDRTSDIKRLNVDIVWRNEKENTEKVLNVAEGTFDELVLDLKASKYDEDGSFMELDEGSVGLFYFTGSVNSNPGLVWEDGEITISFGYEVVKIEEEKEQAPEENQETEEKQEKQEEIEQKQPYDCEEERQKNYEEKNQSEEEAEEVPPAM